jgi:hypothetical protein
MTGRFLRRCLSCPALATDNQVPVCRPSECRNAGWTRSDGWLTSNAICSWEGVGCDDQHCVARMYVLSSCWVCLPNRTLTPDPPLPAHTRTRTHTAHHPARRSLPDNNLIGKLPLEMAKLHR